MAAVPLFERRGPCSHCHEQDAVHHVVEGGTGYISICQSCGDVKPTKVSRAPEVSAETFKAAFRSAVRASLASGEGPHPSVENLELFGFNEQLAALVRQGIARETVTAWLREVRAEFPDIGSEQR